MNTTFEKWSEKLLDAGKGNRLINFKNTSKTLKILLPDIKTIFSKIENGTSLEFFDIDSFIKKNEQSLLNSEENKENFSEELIVSATTNELKKNQILAYKQDSSLTRTLKNIKKIAVDSLLEKGINILYLAFGFLKWKEKEKDDNFLHSPLVLIPIKIESADIKNPTFKLSHYEEEISSNPTLNYLLKNEYNIDLPKFRDENNEDESLEEYFTKIETIVENKGWTIKDTVAIGTFSFLKMNMYEDLKENEDIILENHNVRRLLNLEVEEKATEPINFDEYFKEGKELSLHNVVDADSSQLQAIIQAQTGESFVLQGPPGTGKSQTITNLISEFLYNGKKILFVSEKLEALKVVYNNLKKVGLEDFCLEIHSHKTNKKEFINELFSVLNKNSTTVTENAQEEIIELSNTKEKLDSYDKTLHTQIPIVEKSPYQIISAISKYAKYPKLEVAIKDINLKSSENLKNSTELLTTYANFTESIGNNYHENIWYGYIKTDLSYESKLEFKKNLTTLKTTLEKLNILNQEIYADFDFYLTTPNEVLSKELFFNNFASLTYVDKNFFTKSTLEKICTAIENYLSSKNIIDTTEPELSQIFSKEIYELNLSEYYFKFKNQYLSFFNFLNPSYRNDKKAIKQYFLNPKQKYSNKQFIEFLRKAKDLQTAKKEINTQHQEILNNLSATPEYINWENTLKELNNLKMCLTEDIAVLKNATENEIKYLQNKAKTYAQKTNNLTCITEQIAMLSTCFDTNLKTFENLSIEDFLIQISTYLNNLDGLNNWIKFNEHLNILRNNDLIDFVNESINTNINPTDLANSYTSLYYEQWLYHILSKNELLKNFTRISQDNLVETFKQKDKLKFDISKALIKAKLSNQRPSINSIAPGSQLSTIVREASKKRKQKPIRLLLEETAELVQTIKPCFLMSPLSVSTYLSKNACKFDVVIFDEASQIFPWDAICSIYRAEQLIVVGDSKQMPPSNYFNAEINDESNENNYEEDDSLDFESILDLSATCFKQNRLSWHYRSRTEELINFSNKNFYDGNLTTFPSARKDYDDMGVDFYFVENGIFDRKTRTNKIEAEKVVDLIFEHIKNTPEKSLGVIAFSISQQTAIENIIQERREQNDEYAKFFDINKSDRFFVKNLETVQGDERDTIIFSVAYAKDIDGKFLHNFGPLNQKGGERRLNVAVTRAKYNIKIVSSIKGIDIDPNRTKALGAMLLREYLEYAEQGMEKLILKPSTEISTENSGEFENEIYETISNAGYNVIKNVGCSNYKVDFGIKHPSLPDFVIAIECDGKNYHNCKTTRDRDRLRQENLERLGWKFYRIWSTAWFTNKKAEKEKLLKTIENSILNFNKSNKVTSTPISLPEQTFVVEQKNQVKDLKSHFKTYEHYNIWEHFNKKDKNITFEQVAYEIVKQEAPITADLLLKKTLHFFGSNKITEAVKISFNYATQRQPNLFKIKNYFVADRNMKIELRIPKEGDEARDIMQIPGDELSSGVYEIIKLNIGITKEGLIKTISNLLGFTRIGENIKLRIENAIRNQLFNGNIREENGQYFLNN